MEKSNHEPKAQFMYLCEREKNSNTEITAIIFKVYKKCNLLFNKDFKIAEPFTNKGDVPSICARFTKHESKKLTKVELNLN